jgi:hypothetical protein
MVSVPGAEPMDAGAEEPACGAAEVVRRNRRRDQRGRACARTYDPRGRITRRDLALETKRTIDCGSGLAPGSSSCLAAAWLLPDAITGGSSGVRARGVTTLVGQLYFSPRRSPRQSRRRRAAQPALHDARSIPTSTMGSFLDARTRRVALNVAQPGHEPYARP